MLHNFLKRTIGLRSCVQTVIEIGEVAVEGTPLSWTQAHERLGRTLNVVLRSPRWIRELIERRFELLVRESGVGRRCLAR
jgi:hypothetical protein